MERINARKKNTINVVQCSKCSKIMIIANLRKVTIILIERYRSIDKSIDFYCFQLS